MLAADATLNNRKSVHLSFNSTHTRTPLEIYIYLDLFIIFLLVAAAAAAAAALLFYSILSPPPLFDFLTYIFIFFFTRYLPLYGPFPPTPLLATLAWFKLLYTTIIWTDKVNSISFSYYKRSRTALLLLSLWQLLLSRKRRGCGDLAAIPHEVVWIELEARSRTRWKRCVEGDLEGCGRQASGRVITTEIKQLVQGQPLSFR